MAKLLVLHGPNLNLLGVREPHLYGATDLATINHELTERAKTLGHDCQILQSNAEHVLIDRIHHTLRDGTKFILINPAAFTHTSVALRDALSAVKIPFIEVHLSDINAREAFRQHSYFSDIAIKTISGQGAESYYLALTEADMFLNNPNQ